MVVYIFGFSLVTLTEIRTILMKNYQTMKNHCAVPPATAPKQLSECQIFQFFFSIQKENRHLFVSV